MHRVLPALLLLTAACGRSTPYSSPLPDAGRDGGFDAGTVLNRPDASVDFDAGRCLSPLPPGASVGSNLPGVSLRLFQQAYCFTLDEADAGVSVPYELVVDRAVLVDANPVTGCDPDGPSNLFVSEQLSGNNHSYCLCDLGLCLADEPTRLTLQPGRYVGAFRWTGRDWFGPSDFNNPLGEPFPPGDYLLSLRSAGTVVDGGSYLLKADVPLRLTATGAP